MGNWASKFMAIDYTAWPDVDDVFGLLTSAGVTPTLSSNSDLAHLRIDAAVQEITKRTNRQFVASEEDEARYFNGSGTGAMEIDEYIEISAIQLYTLPQVSTINLLGYVEVERNTYPKTRLQILQGPANMPYGWFTQFPEGRSNVQITGTWGYGETIPADVWQAVLYQAAALIWDTDRAASKGQYKSIKDDDVTLAYRDEAPSSVTGWCAEFDRVCIAYKRPLRRRMMRTVPKLI